MRGAAPARPAAMMVALLALGAGCSSPSPPAEPLPPPATTLIGLDGADWCNAVPLIREGKLPVLAALRRAGASGVMLTNPDYRWSPVLWTTIATGKLPEKHGVLRFLARMEGIERSIPTPSLARRCRALWNIFSDRGLTCGFVGWWVTWPAEPVNGFIVSDHFSVSRFVLGEDFDRDVRDPAFYRHQTYPEGLAKDLRYLKYPRQEVSRGDLARFADLPDDFEYPRPFEKFEKVSEFAIAHSVDRTHFAVGVKLLGERKPDLFGIFFEGIDIMQHFFWEFMDPEGTGTNPSAEERAIFGEAIERYYCFADQLVGALIEAGGDGRSVLVVSDHGFRPSTERYVEKHISGEHRRQAFFLFAGPGVRRGAHLEGLDAVDVTPTVLAYHGLPWAEDMDGEPSLASFTPEWLAAHPPERIPTYEVGERERVELPEESASRDLEERIRALGYIE